MRVKYLSILLVCVVASLSFNSITFAQSSNNLDFGTATIDDLSLIEDFPITPVTLPAVSSDSDTITYSISPTLPAGLAFIPSSRRITGTPTVSTLRQSYRYTARDSVGGDTQSISFSIRIEEDTEPVAPTRTQSIIIIVAPSLVERSLYGFTGGNGILTYSLASTPRLPEGLYFNPRTRKIIGRALDTAEDQNSVATHTYTATDEDGDTATATFDLSIIDKYPIPPSVQDFELVIGESVLLAHYSDGRSHIPFFENDYFGSTPTESPYSYTGLPPGLAHKQNRRLSFYPNDIGGTPVRLGTYRVTYSFSNRFGESASTTFTIHVVEDSTIRPPTRQQSYSFSVGEVVNQTLDAFSGGKTRLVYGFTSSPSTTTPIELIRGLMYNPSARTIYGTVTGGQSEVITSTYTYTARDLYGNMASATFTISIDNSRPTFGSETINDFNLVKTPNCQAQLYLMPHLAPVASLTVLSHLCLQG